MQTNEPLSTEAHIVEEFFILLKEKPYKKISVSALAKKCGINRSTFYRHYTDILDLYEKTCSAVIAETVNVQVRMPPEKSKAYIEACCMAYYKAAMNNIAQIGILYKGNGEVRFFHKVRTAWCDAVFMKMEAFDLHADRDLFLHVSKTADFFVFKLLSPLLDYEKNIFNLYGEYEPDYSKTLLENLLIWRKGSGLGFDLYNATIKFWCQEANEMIPFSVKTLCQNAFVSRALFYTKYKGIFDFVNEIAYSGLSLLSRFILDCALTDMGKNPDTFSYIDLGEEFVAAFKNCLYCDDRTPFIFEVYRSTHDYFLDSIEKTKGTQYTEQNRNMLERYIFSVAYNIIETIVHQNKQDFTVRLNSYNKYRAQLMFS